MRFSQHRDARPFRRRIIHLPPFLLASSYEDGQEIDLFPSSNFSPSHKTADPLTGARTDWVGHEGLLFGGTFKQRHFTSPPYQQRKRYATYFEYKAFETITLSIPEEALYTEDLSSGVLIPPAKATAAYQSAHRTRSKNLKTIPKP